MVVVVIDSPNPNPSPAQLARLEDHLPHSLPLLRRLQFPHFPPESTRNAHYLFASDPDGPTFGGATTTTTNDNGHDGHFAAAYLDLSVGPQTGMWLYSTLQDTDDPNSMPADEVDHVLGLVAALFGRVRATKEAELAAGRYTLHREQGVMAGCLHEGTYRLLCERRGFTSSYWNPHDVWLFRLDGLPVLPERLMALREDWCKEKGLRWDVVGREDVPLIASRTTIPKVESTLMCEPNVAVRDGDGTLVAWGFMGVAGTLSTLHVEEPYRGRGLAKAVATKVLIDHSYGDDLWGSADVHIDNVKSQGVCKSLGGSKGWRTCWTVINYDSMP